MNATFAHPKTKCSACGSEDSYLVSRSGSWCRLLCVACGADVQVVEEKPLPLRSEKAQKAADWLYGEGPMPKVDTPAPVAPAPAPAAPPPRTPVPQPPKPVETAPEPSASVAPPPADKSGLTEEQKDKLVNRKAGTCPTCGFGDLLVKKNRKTGHLFLSCSEWKTQGCEHTESRIPDWLVAEVTGQVPMFPAPGDPEYDEIPF